MLINLLPFLYSPKPIQRDFCEGESRLAENHNSPGKDSNQINLHLPETDSMPYSGPGFSLTDF